MALATTWMDLEIILLSQVIQTEKDIEYNITYMWNLKNQTKLFKLFIYKTEIDSQIQKTDLWLPKGKGGGKG